MSAPPSSDDLPLFPLRTVLYPGAQLHLRIFETRYLDMVRDCMRSGTGFGVCLILSGEETGTEALPAAVGTLASITDFDRTTEGLLAISACGGRRFRVQRSRVRDNGLLTGQVDWWPDEPELPVPVEFALLQGIAMRLVEAVGQDWQQAPQSAYEDAGWLGFRLPSCCR